MIMPGRTCVALMYAISSEFSSGICLRVSLPSTKVGGAHSAQRGSFNYTERPRIGSNEPLSITAQSLCAVRIERFLTNLPNHPLMIVAAEFGDLWRSKIHSDLERKIDTGFFGKLKRQTFVQVFVNSIQRSSYQATQRISVSRI